MWIKYSLIAVVALSLLFVWAEAERAGDTKFGSCNRYVYFAIFLGMLLGIMLLALILPFRKEFWKTVFAFIRAPLKHFVIEYGKTLQISPRVWIKYKHLSADFYYIVVEELGVEDSSFWDDQSHVLNINEFAFEHYKGNVYRLKGLRNEVNPTEQWKHNGSGALYDVIAVGNYAATKPGYPKMVTYRKHNAGSLEIQTWTVPQEQFLQKCNKVKEAELFNPKF